MVRGALLLFKSVTSTPFDCSTNVRKRCAKSAVQNVIFSWTPPATAPGTIQYEFTLKEVPNTMNPMDVIKNQVFPVLVCHYHSLHKMCWCTPMLSHNCCPAKSMCGECAQKTAWANCNLKIKGLASPVFLLTKHATASD
jgi:hypothetical protein